MKDFTSEAIVGLNTLAIDALVQTAASKAFIIHVQAAEALPIGVQNASYQGQDATFIRVALDDAELENYAASARNVVEVIELPVTAAARAKFLAQWAKKIAKKNKTGLLPLLLLPLAACGGGSDSGDPTGVVSATDLNALNSASVSPVDASGVTTITGTASDVSTALASSGITGLGNEAVTLSDTTLAAATLNTLDTNTSGTVDATTVTTLTGTAAAIVTAAQSNGITTAAGYAATVNSSTASVSQALILDADTTGAITATITEGDLATLTTLTDVNGNNALTITVTDTTAAAADLNTVDAITSVAVDATTVTTLTGTASHVNTALSSSGITGLGNEAVTFVISDIETNGIDMITAFTSSTDTALVAAGADLVQFSSADLMAATGFVSYAGSASSITLNDATTKVAFVTGAGAVATEAFATFSYDTTTGQLSFDADGTGSTASSITVATLFSDNLGTAPITDLLSADLQFIA